jgi:hypothetical protein
MKFLEGPGCCIAIHGLQVLEELIFVAQALIEDGIKYEGSVKFRRLK